MISKHRPHFSARPFILRAAPLLFALSLAVPNLTHGIGIGEITLESHLGEPVQARIPLLLGTSESIEEDCLALGAPDIDPATHDQYLTQARLSLQKEGGATYVIVRGSQPLHSAYAKLLLQVSCPGQGSISRGFILLPGIDVTLHPDLPAEAPLIQNPLTPSASDTAATAGAPAKTESTPPTRRRSSLTVRPVENASPPAVAKKSYRSSEFVLRLSSDVDETGAQAPSTRPATTSQVNQDDQTAHILALQHQVKQLQDELNALREGGSASAPVAATPTPKPAPVTAAPAVANDDELMGSLAYAAVAILGLLLVLMLYKRRQQPHAPMDKVEEEVGLFDAPEAAAPGQNEPTAAPAPDHGPQTPPAPTAPASSAPAAEAQESDWVIEEAELYAVHGHPDLAIQILEKLLDQSPNKPQAWLLLLSILSSLERKEDFESAARRFAGTGESRTLWKEVQALGQRIDKDNPLYFGDVQPTHEPVQLRHSNRRPLGAILLDIGAVTEEVLMGVLAQFNPKRDGRIGSYLIKHGLINEAQLETALEIQRQENNR